MEWNAQSRPVNVYVLVVVFCRQIKKKLTKIVGFLKIAAELQLVVHKRLQKNNVL